MEPFDYVRAFGAHEAADREASGATLAAIERAVAEHLPGYRVQWSMTGGGCSGWYLFPDSPEARTEAGPLCWLLTGLSEATEATGDLSEGVVCGSYDDQGCWPGDAEHRYSELDGEPDRIAAEVVRHVRTDLTSRLNSTEGGADGPQ